ncbi:MAG: hypothetical protein JWL63_3312 [Rhodocyclales bacterium]|nr:hypothetical protein [Rhodocyclales bacterium]
MRIIHGLLPAEIDALVASRKEARDKFRADAAQASRRPRKGLDVYQDFSVEPPQNGFGFQADGRRFLTLRLGTHLFIWSSYSGIDSQQAQQSFNSIVSGLRTRDAFVIPNDPGVCLPYAFIRDDGNTPRVIAATYRLREHPDVTIWLQDRDSEHPWSGFDPEKLTPVAKADSFWTYYDSSDRKSLRSVWNDPYRRITLANSKGVESFVRIIRKDDTEDFGYLVVARGDPDAKEDTPDLMLYVIRDTKNAKAKGIEPISKDAFLEMAQTIAASVKRRPTK